MALGLSFFFFAMTLGLPLQSNLTAVHFQWSILLMLFSAPFTMLNTHPTNKSAFYKKKNVN